jgi:hypothetical protein
MDIGSLIAAALLSLGLLGADAVINAGNVIFQVAVTKRLAERGYTPAVVDSLLDSDLKEVVEFRSMVHRTRVRSAEQKSIVGAVADSLNLKDVTAAFQSEFGLDSIRLTGSLMDGDTGEFRFILGGTSLHVGKFTIDMTSRDKQTLPEFLNDVSGSIATHLEPYAVAVDKFRVLQRKNKYLENDGDHEEFQAFVIEQIKLETNEGGTTDDRAAFFNLLGMVSLLYHAHDCAKLQFEQAVKADPALGVPELNLALLALVERHFDEAVKRALAAERAPEMRSEPFLVANARTLVGLALWGKGDLRGAAEQFRTAVTIYPGAMWGYLYWSELEGSLGNKDSQALLAERAEHNLQFFESYPEVALMYARVDPSAAFRFSRVDTARARHLDDLQPARAEQSEEDELMAAPHTCAKI